MDIFSKAGAVGGTDKLLTGSGSPGSPESHNSETDECQQVTCRAGVQPCQAGTGHLLIQGTGLLCWRMEMIKELTTQMLAGRPHGLALMTISTIYHALILCQT